MSQSAALSRGLEPADVVLGGRGFCSYAQPARLSRRRLNAVFRVHPMQLVDFTPGRVSGRRAGSKGVAGLPRSRSVLAQGDSDHVAIWSKVAVHTREPLKTRDFAVNDNSKTPV